MVPKGPPFLTARTGVAKKWEHARSNADRLTKLLHPGRRAMVLPPLDDASLAKVLQVRIVEAETAARRARWFGGRLINALTGQDPDYTPLSGRHLEQVLSQLDLDVPATLFRDRSYRVRVDILRDALARLDARADESTHAS